MHFARLLEGGGGGEGRAGRVGEERRAVVCRAVERGGCYEGDRYAGAERGACAAEGVGEQFGGWLCL